MQWHQLDCMQTICTSLQTDSHTHHSIFTDRMLFLMPMNSVKALKALNGLHVKWLLYRRVYMCVVSVAVVCIIVMICNETSVRRLFAVITVAAAACRWRGAKSILTDGLQQFAVDQPCRCWKPPWSDSDIHAHTHTCLFNGPFSGTTQVSRYQKGETSLDFTEARDSEWQ